jgi:hypothetical protein
MEEGFGIVRSMLDMVGFNLSVSRRAEVDWCATFTVLSSQNFVGKWKYYSPDAQWEGVWSLSKAEATDCKVPSW